MIRRKESPRRPEIDLALVRANAALSLANGTTPALKQSSWFIDPQNVSGKASPSNDGLTALTPIDRFSTMFQRWGTHTPIITGSTVTVTLMSDGVLDGSDPVDLRPECSSGGGFILSGTLKQLATGTFGVVTPQNRATAQRYTATVSGALPANWWAQWVGMLVHDTVTDAWFWVQDDLGAQTALFTRPKASSIASLTSALLTIGNGDAFVIYDLTAIDLVRFSPGQQNFANATFTQTYPCQMQHVATATGAAFAQASTTHYEGDCLVVECRMLSREPTLYDGNLLTANCYCGGPDMLSGFGLFGAISGVVSANDQHAVFQGGTILLDGDAAVDDHVFPSNAQVIVGLAFYTAGVFKIPNGQADSFAGAGASLVILPYFYGQCALWGPCSVECSAGGDIVYQGLAVTAFQNTGGLLIDGVGTASSYDGAGTWHGGIALNPANLDAAAGAAGFGGCAYGVKGSKIHQWV